MASAQASPTPRARPPLPKTAKALVVGLMSALATLAVLEIAVRLLGLHVSPHDALRYHPRLGWTLNPENRSRGGVNELGFRHPPVPPAKPPGIRRLVILGDSFAQGTAYPYRATFAGLLAEWLDAGTGERWQVINLGISGWGTGQQYLALRELGIAYQPDAVVLQTLPFNDVCNNALALAHACDTEDTYRPYFVLDEGGSLRRTWDQPWRARLRSSALFRLLERRVPALGPPAPAPVPAGAERLAHAQALMELHRRHAEAAGLDHRVGLYTLLPEDLQPPAMQEAWAVTERLLDGIAGLIGAADVPLIGAAVPFADALDPGWLERAGQPGAWPRGPEGAPLDAAIGTERMERLLADRAAALIPMQRLVLAGPMRPADHFYPYGKSGDRHLNAFGHWRLASWIVDELRRLGLTSVEPPAPTVERVDLLAGDGYPVVERSFSRNRRDRGERERRGFGPASRLAFLGTGTVPMHLLLTAEPGGGTEEIRVLANGELAGVLALREGETTAAEIPFTAAPGRNEIRLVYRGWRRGDRRTAAEITELVLEAVPESPNAGEGGRYPDLAGEG